jgi:hypothetical protein
MIEDTEDGGFATRFIDLFQGRGHVEKIRSIVLEIRGILCQQNIEENQLVVDFRDYLRTNPSVRESFASVSQPNNDDSKYFDLIQYLFDFRGGQPFVDFVNQVSKEIEREEAGTSQPSAD